MAVIQVNFMSKTLGRSVPMNVILPVDKMTFPGMPVRAEKPYKTLYLLHGVLGNYTDWVTGTNIVRWAMERDLAVVMPSGDNMFYVDNPWTVTNQYGEFIGKELVDITRKMFPLSEKKEDTYIAGLSMGGYGALRNGLKYHDTFGCIAALSSALIIDGIENTTNDGPFFATRGYLEGCFGDLTKVAESDMNPKWLANKLVEDKVNIPDIYLACGKEDSLLEANQDFRNYLKNLDIEVTYEEGPGGHDWDYWGQYIKRVLEWLPLENKAEGINSGNVGI
ncbi:alpha/beta hydrolase [Lederbergia wuyishanensis]|uniref:S-formylglutathione hydrolase FrmB n=1 Tax=Lederbergia wuyishanensis TaxID=1347903 RepID=A0ABU0D5N0_9BACI|nr:alpha/beta hydrolase family protein [Lederbergia wuyishanensis]MCJ8008293.1 esterase family protein [Lederbergia wuyishanensis]MDQ0343705.1 S-formylglutathione hydrolase FrmB [Lederbergia wuyishanensis]